MNQTLLVLLLRSGGVTIFESSNDDVFAMIYSLASTFHERKEFTDVYKFKLICGVCGTKCIGQTDAQEHAKLTGHVSFQEYSGT